MVRITARQAYTRSRSKRERKKVDIDKALVEARRRYIRQLSSLSDLTSDINNNFNDDSENQRDRSNPQPMTSRSITRKASSRRNTSDSLNKKITDFFSKTTHLESVHKFRANHSLRTSSSINRDGIETITIYDSENDDNGGTSPDDSTTSNDACPESSSSTETHPIKLESMQCRLSLDGLKLRVDEEIEIVEMLPPIPLRDHPVFDVDV